MKRLADRLLSFLLSRRSMFAFNRMLLMAALRGLGIGNWRREQGEFKCPKLYELDQIIFRSASHLSEI